MKQGIVRTKRTVCNREVRGAREICFNQSKALHRSGKKHVNQYGETKGEVAKCRLFTQAIVQQDSQLDK